MSDRLLLKELRSIREVNKPSSLWRDNTRQSILALAEKKSVSVWSGADRWREGWLEFRWRLSAVPAVAGVVATVMVLVGSLAVSPVVASAQPGDWLYSVKRLEERVELSFKTNPTAQGIFYLKLADRRLQELSVVPIGDAKQAELLRDYNVTLSFAQANYQAVSPTLHLAQTYDVSTGALIESLNKVVVNNELKSVYTSARKLTKDINSRSLSTMVALHQPNGNGSQQEVSDRLQAEITKVEEQLATVQTKLQGLPQVQQRTSKVVIESRRQVMPAMEAGEEATKTLAEAKELLDQKEFSLALEKLKEGEVIALKTEEVVDELVAEEGEVKGEAVTEEVVVPETVVEESANGGAADAPIEAPVKE